MPVTMTRSLMMTVCLAGTLFVATACSDDHGHDHPHRGGASTTQDAQPDAQAVSWPRLTELDDLIHEADDMILLGEWDALRETLPRIHEMAIVVAQEEIPQDARNTAEVAVLQRDLLEVAESLESPEETDSEIARNVSGIIALTEQIMESAGVPHTHGEFDLDDGHDHDGHDHDGHDHDGHDHHDH